MDEKKPVNLSGLVMPPKEEPKPKSVDELTLDECRQRLTELTHKHDGHSNIPLNSEYWDVRKRYQVLRNR